MFSCSALNCCNRLERKYKQHQLHEGKRNEERRKHWIRFLDVLTQEMLHLMHSYLRSMRLIITVLGLLTLIVNNCFSSSESGFRSLTDTVEAMDKLMAYLSGQNAYIIDLLFGVLLAREQLNILSRHLATKLHQDQPLSQSHLKEWIAACDKIQSDSSILMANEGQNTTRAIFQNVIRPGVWELDKNMTIGLLRKPSGHWKLGSTYWKSRSNKWLRASGKPTEEQSDKCITELTKCKLSPKCWRMMTKNDRATGYSLTHRLLYLQVARQLNCLQSTRSTRLAEAQDSILKICSNILREAENLYELGPPNGLADLLLEQISLCGIEGYAEFLKPEWLETILTWQTPRGCFSETLRARTRFKRDDYPLGEDCTMHITGVGATALSLFLRAILEQP